jgi:hypothetical protein
MGERRACGRVHFDRGYAARIMAIDGTWQRACRIGNISDSGARLHIIDSMDGLETGEFFLMLSARGNAFRRCARVWLRGDELGVRVLKDRPRLSKERRPHGKEPGSVSH